MKQKTRVGTRELIAMLTIFVASNAFLMYPRYVSQTTLEAAWMEPIISGAITLIVFLIVEMLLSKYFPYMDIVQVSQETFGKPITMFFILIVVGYFILSTASVSRQFTENVITTVLPSTPILLIGAVFMAASAYIAYMGLEGICRTAYFVQPILIIGILALCLMTANWWHPMYLFPIWGSGPWVVLKSSVFYISIFNNVLLLCVIFPHAYHPRDFRVIGTVSIVVSTLLLTAFLVTFHMVFSPVEAGKASFALYQMARMIYLGRFFQRLESIFVFLWVTAAIVKMAVSLWGAGYLLGKAVGWKSFRPSIPSISLLCFAISLWHADLVRVITMDDQYLMQWGWTVVFALPVFIILSGVIRHHLRRGGGGRDKRRNKRRRTAHA
ncbi:GerAB/ArcD/ProY family transporter [Alicyclobacillus tolerans]|uniref:GerAB/ArcD/ProY family transporter n=1 Tax=Alicyclobacillus tolerans TaxID=90970 RepID=UPI003B827E79